MAQYRFVDKGPRIIWVPFWLLVSSRPRQWLKNLAIYATLVFEGEFFNIDKFLLTTLGFAIFCVVTSGIYIINDIIDLEKDKHHPFKSKRPIAAGRINPILALVFALVLLAVAFIASYQISTFFTFAAVSYAILQIIYSLFLRSIIPWLCFWRSEKEDRKEHYFQGQRQKVFKHAQYWCTTQNPYLIH